MIRKAVQSDIDMVSEIYAHIQEQERQNKLGVGWLPGVYPVRETAKKALARGDLFVYEEAGKVLASAIINKEQVDVYAQGAWNYPADDDRIMVIHTLAVDPGAASRGIGRQFVAFYEDYARMAGCEALRLDTNAKNAAARRLYAGLGFREAGIVPCDFNGIPNIRLVLLEKRL